MKKAMATLLTSALILFGAAATVSLPSVALADGCNGASDPVCQVTTTETCTRTGYCPFTSPFIGVVPCCYESETTTTYSYYPDAM